MPICSYQLYSSRNFGPLSETLSMLGAIGYDAVEGYGAILSDDQALPALEKGLDTTGMAMPSGHFDFQQIKHAPEAVIATTERFGMHAVFVPYLQPDERPTDRAGWQSFAAELAEVAKPYSDAGLTFGWHNHDFEFQALPEGSFPIEHLLGASDQIMIEFDLAWAQIAGQDPAAWLDRLGPRIAAAHIKDVAPQGEKTDEDGMADIGTGIMDWDSLSAKLQALNVSLCIAEHDNPSDDHRFASTALAAMRAFDAR